MATTFILSDESINSYGARVLTAGIDLSLFKSNPIMLWVHNRSWRGTRDEVLPIGHWENIRVEGTQLLADAVFDTEDEFAQKIASKVEQGIIRMASIAANIIVTSEDKSVLVQGQTRPTIVKCLLTEASIVDIGSNRNALRLSDEYGSEIKLSDTESNHLLPLLADNQPTNNNNMDLINQLSTALQLTDATESQIVAAVTNTTAEVVQLRSRVAGYEAAEASAREAAIAALVDSAIADRRIVAADRESYITLATANYDTTKALLDKMPAVIKLSSEGDGVPKESAWDKRNNEINKNKQR